MLMGWKKSGELIPLFDRLHDENPRQKQESPIQKTYNVEQIRASVLSELFDLLDTRIPFNRSDYDDASFYEDTVFNLKSGYPFFYGISDFSFYDIASTQGQEQLENEIQRAVEIFEPRLENISITIQKIDRDNQSIVLQLDATLKVGEIVEAFTFPISIEKGSVKKK